MMYRNNPSGIYKAHLYNDKAVEKGGGPPHAGDRVLSLCGRSPSYGPFTAVEEPEEMPDPEDSALCKHCLHVWASRRRNAADAGGEA